ncbi:hypothetical protein C5748_23790 [Phyllobacterium phragmitis]|uniref:Uncharacterized protein n=1 Tax=Phyllobacterium phragmitis TaxID=2670329 RepID=A0A2S9IKF8_9HYPH|nr:hypothetical protein C5748_23790 [Phyllobacterium phragmitis]
MPQSSRKLSVGIFHAHPAKMVFRQVGRGPALGNGGHLRRASSWALRSSRILILYESGRLIDPNKEEKFFAR